MNVDSKQTPDNLKIFQALCEATAVLWQVGEYGDDARALHTAVDRCFSYQTKLKLDTDQAQEVMAQAFAVRRDDL